MIRKFLISGKQQLFLTSQEPEKNSLRDGLSACELILPLEVFWDIEKSLRELDYLRSAFEDQVKINLLHRKILDHLSKYAVLEKDRDQLRALASGSKGKA